jgi:sugar/nucleoside kinase (ribokinase family)
MKPPQTPEIPEKDSTLALTPKALELARAKRVLVGFDGFVDEIVTPVAARHGPGEDHVPFASIADFAERIASAGGGRNANIEIVPRLERLGGNGPILANGLLSLGGDVRYVGALGTPDVHSLFVDLAHATHAVSLANPGRTMAFEFADGKIIFGMAQSLDDVTYSSLMNALGEEGLDRALDEADALAFVDWTMVPGFTGILRGIHECILPRISPKDRLFFFDLADPTKRDSNELRTTLEIIALYSRFGRVNLGLNRKEARQVLAVLGRGACSESAPLEEFAIEIRQRLAIEAVVVHTRDCAACAEASGTSCEIEVPVCVKPRVFTGAGDHFNAGYLFGRNAGLFPPEAIRAGALVATAYVTNGFSPDADCLTLDVRSHHH